MKRYIEREGEGERERERGSTKERKEKEKKNEERRKRGGAIPLRGRIRERKKQGLFCLIFVYFDKDGVLFFV